MDRTYIWGIDPGSDVAPASHTGVSIGYYSDTEPYTFKEGYAIGGGLAGFLNWSQTAPWREGLQIVLEKFTPWSSSRVDSSPQIIEGAVRTLVSVSPYFIELHLQPASGKNTAVPNEVMYEFGVYEDKSHHHDIREATRHVLWFLKKNKHMPTLQKGWGDY